MAPSNNGGNIPTRFLLQRGHPPAMPPPPPAKKKTIWLDDDSPRLSNNSNRPPRSPRSQTKQKHPRDELSMARSKHERTYNFIKKELEAATASLQKLEEYRGASPPSSSTDVNKWSSSSRTSALAFKHEISMTNGRGVSGLEKIGSNHGNKRREDQRIVVNGFGSSREVSPIIKLSTHRNNEELPGERINEEHRSKNFRSSTATSDSFSKSNHFNSHHQSRKKPAEAADSYAAKNAGISAMPRISNYDKNKIEAAAAFAAAAVPVASSVTSKTSVNPCPENIAGQKDSQRVQLQLEPDSYHQSETACRTKKLKFRFHDIGLVRSFEEDFVLSFGPKKKSAPKTARANSVIILAKPLAVQHCNRSLIRAQSTSASEALIVKSSAASCIHSSEDPDRTGISHAIMSFANVTLDYFREITPKHVIAATATATIMTTTSLNLAKSTPQPVLRVDENDEKRIRTESENRSSVLQIEKKPSSLTNGHTVDESSSIITNGNHVNGVVTNGNSLDHESEAEEEEEEEEYDEEEQELWDYEDLMLMPNKIPPLANAKNNPKWFTDPLSHEKCYDLDPIPEILATLTDWTRRMKHQTNSLVNELNTAFSRQRPDGGYDNVKVEKRPYHCNLVDAMIGYDEVSLDENNELHGFYREVRRDRVECVGLYKKGQRYGLYWKAFDSYGYLVGFIGSTLALYLYPDLTSVICGNFDAKGRLIKGRFGKVLSLGFIQGMPVPKVKTFTNSKEFMYDPSTSMKLSSSPLLRDPFEQERCYVAKSTAHPDAGEGLFAKQRLEPGSLIAIFNGVRIRQITGVATVASAYKIHLNSEVDLDIPDGSISLKKYCATLAHKACHSFEPNAGFQSIEHPRFGKCMSIAAFEPIEKGEEIFVSYNYRVWMAPAWYQALWVDHMRNGKNATEEEIYTMVLRFFRTYGNKIEIHPPDASSPRFCPCGLCSNHVGLDICSIRCEDCERWFHAKCTGLEDEIVANNSDTFKWSCDQCLMR